MSLARLRKAMERTDESFYKDLSVVFSGYNIKSYIEGAVTSFLHFYPHMKDNIIVFDDDSTDGTREWLEQNGIRRITWSEESRQKYARDAGVNLTFRCNMIVHETMKQVTTKYLFTSDGDIRFIRRFLEEYQYKMQHYKILASIGINLSDDKMRLAMDSGALKLVMYGDSYLRVWQGHMLLDLEFFKQQDLWYDPDDFSYYEQSSALDSGAKFLADIMERDIPIYDIPCLDKDRSVVDVYDYGNRIYLHYGGKSCQERNKGGHS